MVRDVANVHLARKRYEVVLAQAGDINVLDDDHLVVILVEDGVVDDIPNVLPVALGEGHDRFGVAFGRVEEARSVWVFADGLEDGLDCVLDLVETLSRGVGGLLESCSGFNAC